MATVTIPLPIPGGLAPDQSGTGNDAAIPFKIVSTGTQTTNTPKVSYVHLLFNKDTDKHWMWQFQLPGDWVSGGTVRLLWGSAVTTGDVIWKAGVEIGVAATTDMDAAIFNAADAAAASTVPGTVGHFKETTIALTTTGAAANTYVVLFVGRDADAAGDTAAGDAQLLAASFTYLNA